MEAARILLLHSTQDSYGAGQKAAGAPAPEHGKFEEIFRQVSGPRENPPSEAVQNSRDQAVNTGDAAGEKEKSVRRGASGDTRSGNNEKAAADAAADAADADAADTADAAADADAADTAAAAEGGREESAKSAGAEKSGKTEKGGEAAGKIEPKIKNGKAEKWNAQAVKTDTPPVQDGAETAGDAKLKGISAEVKDSADSAAVQIAAALDTAGEKAVQLGAGGGHESEGRAKTGTAAQKVITNNLDDRKTFFFVDKRTGRGGEPGAVESAESAASRGKNGNAKGGASSELTEKENRSGGKSAEGLKEFGKNGNSDNLQLVKEEVLESSEKFVKFATEPQIREGIQNRTDSFGRHQTQSAQLQRHLAEQGNRQIVKQTGIILKDNNSGEIKLILKPESMGSVRIQLQMQDSSITGRILVDNSAVKAAFDQNMNELYKAFKESGFETAELDVQVGGERGGEKREGEDNRPGIAMHRIQMIEEQIPLSGRVKSADTLIDLVV